MSFRSLRKGYAIACCTKHAAILSRPATAKTNLERYGSTTPLQYKQIRAKINQHNVETYGTKYVTESEFFKKKRIKTCQHNFGVEYPMQSKEVQAKSRKRCKEKYGVEYVLQSDYAKAKGKETSRQLYGTDFPMQSVAVKDKSKKTFREKYGVDAPAQCPDIRQKQQFRCKFHGIRFDSLHEIAYYVWLQDHNIMFEYAPNVKFKYVFEGKEHFYMPDFIVDGQYVEIKGDHFFKEDGTMRNPFNHSQDGLYEAKHQCMVENNVKIMKTSDMQDILKYIYETYGKDYLKHFRQCAQKHSRKI